MSRIILASASPRRRELLKQLGIDCEVRPADIDETPLANEAPDAYVERLAVSKATHIARQLQPAIGAMQVAGDSLDQQVPLVLAADTSVICDGQILGKPEDRDHAIAMLLQLSGRTHYVLTGTAIVCGKKEASAVVRTGVEFRPLGRQEAERYWASGEPLGKAGAYAIQGRAAVFIKSIHGSYSNVVGLPLFEVAELLRQNGFHTF